MNKIKNFTWLFDRTFNNKFYTFYHFWINKDTQLVDARMFLMPKGPRVTKISWRVHLTCGPSLIKLTDEEIDRGRSGTIADTAVRALVSGLHLHDHQFAPGDSTLFLWFLNSFKIFHCTMVFSSVCKLFLCLSPSKFVISYWIAYLMESGKYISNCKDAKLRLGFF